ncbi:hypothetical protein SAMN05421594_1081 [Chryseobacterium oleae]|uniref:Uncharacterized protein n=1 Tax=Chryseobacterium oleae TaxID=491207 RepID=A0A1I4WBH5_CHROL|nr:hypothetical protein SAMN05421594_1081 [Chryseobacterium oleae]
MNQVSKSLTYTWNDKADGIRNVILSVVEGFSH